MSTQNSALRFRLYPTPAQEQALLAQGHGARAIWNLLHEWFLVSGENTRVSWKDCDAVVRQARKDIPWIKAVPAQAAQQVIKTYSRAWVSFWSGVTDKPDYHARSGKLSIDVPQARDLNWTRDSRKWSRAKLPLVGRVKIRQHRAIPAKATVTGARVVREPDGSWFIALRIRKDIHVKTAPMEPLVGIDRGVTIPLALSNGEGFRHRTYLTPREQERFLRLSRLGARRREARRERGERRPSANERKAYDGLAVLHARARRRRADWLHKASHAVAEQYATVGLEALPVANMVRSARGTKEKPGINVRAKAGLNRVIHNEAWSSFQLFLAYKVENRGGRVITVPAPGTSQKCHRCRTTTTGSRESQARFRCKNPECGWSGNADLNAALNVEYDTRIALGMGVEHVSSAGAVRRSPRRGTTRRNRESGDQDLQALAGSRRREQNTAESCSA